MSIGNLKDYGNKGNNFPWQLKMLVGQQCACDALKNIADNTDTVEPLLAQILTAIQNGTDYEAMLVVDNAGVTWLEVRIWNGTTFNPPIYFLAGSNTTGTPVAPITYINPNTYLAQIVSYTSNLVSINAGTPNALGQTTMVNSMPVVIASNQTAVPASQSGTWNLNNITGTVSLPTGAATEATLLLVNNNLSSASRTPGIKTYVNAAGSTTAGIYSFSIANVGSASGLVDGEVLPAGVTVNFDGGAMNNTLTAMTFDATGTTFVVTTIS